MPIRLPQGNFAISDLICRRLSFLDGTQQITAAGGVGPITPSRITLPQVNEPLTPTLAFGDGNTGFFEGVDDNLTVVTAGVSRWDFNASGFFISPSTGGASLRNSGASATVPTLAPNRSDLDTGIGSSALDQLSLIAGGVQVANLTEAAGLVQFIVPVQNNASAPSIAFGVAANEGFFTSSPGILRISLSGINQFLWNNGTYSGAAANAAALVNETPSATNPGFVFVGDSDTGMGRVLADQLALIAGGINCLSVSEVAGAARIGFYGGSPVALQTGVAVTTAAVHAALVNLRLITA